MGRIRVLSVSTSRIKTIAIAVLLLVNVLFLSVIVIDAVDDMLTERDTIKNVCQVLRAGGISINPDDILTAGAIRSMRTARSLESEKAIAEAILGRTEVSDQGVIYLYENKERGVAEFASAGDFEIRLHDGVVATSNDALRTAQELLRSMKLDATKLSVVAVAGSETVTAVNAYRGVSIFNCTIEFVFNEGSLTLIKGRYGAGFEPAGDGGVISPVGTALLGFLAEVKREEREDVCSSEIFSVEAGYQYRAASFGEGVISPAWLVATDTGTYLIDDVTGEIRILAGGW